jgi:signal transduction histidine kinase
MDGRLERALSWMTSPLSRHPAGSDTSPTDLTDTQVAEGEVWESPELLRLIVATLPVGVSVIDRSGNIVLTNAASELIWGDTIVSGEERWARSRAFWHGTSKRIGPSEWASVRCLRDGQTILNELIDIEAFDGRRKTIQNSAVPIRNAAGEIVGSLILNEEVTDRVHAESVLRESADRSQDFSRRLLVVQEEERRHLSRELHDEFGQLLAGIAMHLQAAKGLVGGAASSRIEECVRLIQRAGTELRNLVLELRPTMLESAGLMSTLKWLAEQHTKRTGIATQVVGQIDDLSGDLAIVCFPPFRKR